VKASRPKRIAFTKDEASRLKNLPVGPSCGKSARRTGLAAPSSAVASSCVRSHVSRARIFKAEKREKIASSRRGDYNVLFESDSVIINHQTRDVRKENFNAIRQCR
jgi:hypothetical protein